MVVGQTDEGSDPLVTPSGQDRAGDNAGDFANTGKNSGKLWIIFVSVIGVLLCGFIVFSPKEKDR